MEYRDKAGRMWKVGEAEVLLSSENLGQVITNIASYIKNRELIYSRI